MPERSPPCGESSMPVAESTATCSSQPRLPMPDSQRTGRPVWRSSARRGRRGCSERVPSRSITVMLRGGYVSHHLTASMPSGGGGGGGGGSGGAGGAPCSSPAVVAFASLGGCFCWAGEESAGGGVRCRVPAAAAARPSAALAPLRKRSVWRSQLAHTPPPAPAARAPSSAASAAAARARSTPAAFQALRRKACASATPAKRRGCSPGSTAPCMEHMRRGRGGGGEAALPLPLQLP